MDRSQLKRIYHRINTKVEDCIGDIGIIMSAYGDNYPIQTQAFETMFFLFNKVQKIFEVLYEQGLL